MVVYGGSDGVSSFADVHVLDIRKVSCYRRVLGRLIQ